MSEFKYNDTKLYYETYGEGMPILLIHGWGIDHCYLTGCMEPVFGTMKDEFKRFYVDLPGMGRSKEGSVHNTEDIVEVLLTFIKENIKGDFLLAGNSYGGLISRIIANKMPDRIKGMILICTSQGNIKRTLPERYVLKKDNDLLNELDKKQIEHFASMNVRLTRDVWGIYQRDIYPAVLQNEDNHFLNHVLDGDISLQFQHEIDHRVFDKPVLILTGKQDTCVGYEDQFKWIKPYPRADYHAIEGAGHNLSMDQPQLFECIVKSWLINFMIKEN